MIIFFILMLYCTQRKKKGQSPSCRQSTYKEKNLNIIFNLPHDNNKLSIIQRNWFKWTHLMNPSTSERWKWIKKKKMKLYGIQILWNKDAFKILWRMGPSLYSFKSHPSHSLPFYHCEQNANARNKCASEFCSGWIIQMLWNKDVGKNKISLIIDILIFWFYGYIEYIKDMLTNILEKKYWYD